VSWLLLMPIRQARVRFLHAGATARPEENPRGMGNSGMMAP
jgi:hypothetical protein